ncbi:MAG: ABC transporter permease [Bacteroidota bacterium]
MDTTIDIRWIELITGFLVFLIPVIIFVYYKTGLLLSTLIASARMAVQLILVGIYLEYLFVWNYGWINSAWVMIMIIVASFTTSRKSGLKNKFFFIPNFLAILISIVIVDAFFLGYIIRLDYVFDARYLIPITGMILGNALQNNIIGLNSFYTGIRRDENTYRFFLASGATRGEASFPFIQAALKNAFNPTIARMAVIGLIALPGTMTGQIIGGSSPGVAIKYQILLMMAIFASSILSVFLAIFISNLFVFDKYSNLKKEVFRKKF